MLRITPIFIQLICFMNGLSTLEVKRLLISEPPCSIHASYSENYFDFFHYRPDNLKKSCTTKKSKVCKATMNLRGGSNSASALNTIKIPTREEVDKGLECTMCLSFLCRPRTLSCGHSFCEPCIISWLRTGNLICPLCRSPLTERGVINPNYALEVACGFIFGEEYVKRLREFEDINCVPPKVVNQMLTYLAHVDLDV